MYHGWQKDLPSSLEVCPVQYPGHGTRFREELFTDLTLLADATAEGLRPLVEGPFALFGHSMGAVLAFEIVRRFEKMGLSPNALLLAGARAPHLRPEEPLSYDLPDPEFLAELRKINGTPPEILDDREAMEFLIPILRADFQAMETYRVTPAPQLRCPISVFGGCEDHKVTTEHLDGWRDHSIGPFSRTLIEGTHFFVNESRAQLVKYIGQLLLPHLPT